MKLAVVELPDERAAREQAWKVLVRALRARPVDVLVLPELPFCEWRVFCSRDVDLGSWRSVVSEHEEQIARFDELSAGIVLASRPIELEGKRLNQGFAWTRERGVVGARSKRHLPDEPDGRESTWFARGDRSFAPLALGPLTVGFQLCTELLYSDASREIGRAGAQLIAAPRATGGHRRWPMAAGLAAVMSGCFVASANRRSRGSDPFTGRSWIHSPEGEMLAETSEAEPLAVVDVDLEEVARARRTYPRSLPAD